MAKMDMSTCRGRKTVKRGIDRDTRERDGKVVSRAGMWYSKKRAACESEQKQLAVGGVQHDGRKLQRA